MLLAVSALTFLAYAPYLSLPLIADDYQQIQYARDFAPVSGWPALAHDALYRCRATSLLFTYWTEQLFGWNVFAFNVSSMVLHILNALLVCALGLWRIAGWRVSIIAACAFAVFSQHSEAVIWYAALPELLVFTFTLAAFLCWVCWLQAERPSWPMYGASFGLFVLALLSKESAVALVGLQALTVALDARRPWKRLWAVAPFAALSVLYFGMAFLERKTHQHFNDGTFTLGVHFIPVMLRSAFRLLWFWNFSALVALLVWKAWHWRSLLIASTAWIAITLLPYSFLTYNPVVPSRHRYLASAAGALILAAGLLELYRRVPAKMSRWTAAALVVLFWGHQSYDLWARKHFQYRMRAEPTEQLYRHARRAKGVLYVKCFPYWEGIGEMVLQQRMSTVRPRLVFGGLALQRADAVDLCNRVTGRGRY